MSNASRRMRRLQKKPSGHGSGASAPSNDLLTLQLTDKGRALFGRALSGLPPLAPPEPETPFVELTLASMSLLVGKSPVDVNAMDPPEMVAALEYALTACPTSETCYGDEDTTELRLWLEGHSVQCTCAHCDRFIGRFEISAESRASLTTRSLPDGRVQIVYDQLASGVWHVGVDTVLDDIAFVAEYGEAPGREQQPLKIRLPWDELSELEEGASTAAAALLRH